MKIFSMVAAFLMAQAIFHGTKALAFGVQPTSMVGRISAVMFGVVILGVLVLLTKKWASNSFLNGFLAATGLFLSFDIVVFHWFFHLHRITSGPEANVLEPIFVVAGTYLVSYAVKLERKHVQNRNNTFSA